MTIWIILMLSVFSGGLSLATLNAMAEMQALGREVMRKNGLNPMAPMGCLIALAGVVQMAAWVVYAFQVQDWRFAAISGIPFLISWVGRSLHGRAAKVKTGVTGG